MLKDSEKSQAYAPRSRIGDGERLSVAFGHGAEKQGSGLRFTSPAANRNSGKLQYFLTVRRRMRTPGTLSSRQCHASLVDTNVTDQFDMPQACWKHEPQTPVLRFLVSLHRRNQLIMIKLRDIHG